MSAIVDLLQEIRHRPAIYLGSPSLVKLAAFLRGFAHALEKYPVAGEDRFLEEFRDWVIQRYSVTGSQSWENIIAFHSANESEAMEVFWSLFDEYLSEKADSGKLACANSSRVPRQ